MTDALITLAIPQAFSQQTTGSGYNSPPAASYFPSSTPSPSYAAPAPATFAPAAPSYSAPAPAPAPAPSYAPAPAPAPAPAYVAPVAQDEYGSPQAPVQDEYGSPQAPVSNGYAPPQPSYAASPGYWKKTQSWQKISCRVTTTWVQSLCGRGDTQLGRSLGEVQGQDLSEDPGS